jgi:ABC-type ATPase involved in cell division/GNAT superfamily N-acetyltransferase
MPGIDIVVETALSRSPRVRQLEAMFDVPASEKATLRWHGDLPIEDADWNVGLIVGPSGAGKSTILRETFGGMPELSWSGASVLDDFAPGLSMRDISAVCQAVGFNTIPAWMRPYAVLSNGERFRVDLARRMLESGDPIVIDEFTSVVDRQVAQIGAHAAQKYVRRAGRRLVAASCHYDIVDWLQPDWVFEPSTMTFSRRSLQRRPALDVSVCRVPYDAWRMFAPFHYLTADLHRAARCFVLFVGDRPASFGAMLHRPHPKAKDIIGLSRLVTLPDWQGLGLAMILADALGSAYKALGKRMHTYPAHPSLIRSFAKSERWAMTQSADVHVHDAPRQRRGRQDQSRRVRRQSTRATGWPVARQRARDDSGSCAPTRSARWWSVVPARRTSWTFSEHVAPVRLGGPGNMAPGVNAGPKAWQQGRRPCAVFEYRGAPMDADDARRMIDGAH